MSSLREPSACPSPFAVGTLLGGGKFKICGVLGEGGMGLLYDAQQLSVGRRVAIKVLSDKADEPSARERFRREAQMLAQLRHPNIVTLHDFDVEPGGYGYLVFEYLSGRPLSRERGGLPIERCLKIAKQVCRALAAAHAIGIVHRDIKPANIFLTDEYETDFVKVLDFGIARSIPDEKDGATRLTEVRHIVGSPHFLSPEQIRDDEFDHRADLYALGCLLFWMTTGSTVFRGPVAELVTRHLSEAPPRFCDVRPDLAIIDPGFEAVVMRLLEKRPEDRFPSALAVEAKLDEWIVQVAAQQRVPALRAASSQTEPSPPAIASSGTETFDGNLQPADVFTDLSTDSKADRSVPRLIEANDSEPARTRAERLPAHPVRRTEPKPNRLWTNRLLGFAAGSFAAVFVVTSLQRSARIETSAITLPQARHVFRESAAQSATIAEERPRTIEPAPEHAPQKDEGAAAERSKETLRSKGLATPQERSPDATLRAIRVISGPADPSAIESELRSREADLARCFQKTQRTRKTLRLTIVDTSSKQEIDARPSDDETTAFLACVRALDPPFVLSLPKTSGVQVISAELASPRVNR